MEYEISKYKPNYVNIIDQDTSISELYVSTVTDYDKYN